MGAGASAKKTPPAPEIVRLPIRVRIWADREVSIAHHAKTLARVRGVTAVAIDDAAKIATVTYTGDTQGILEIGAAVNSQGAVIDPAWFAVRGTPSGLPKLPENLARVRGVTRVQAVAGGAEFWASVPELDLDALVGSAPKLSFVNCDLLEIALAPRGGAGKAEVFRKLLLETRGVLRADLSGATMRILALKGRVTPDALRKLGAAFEIEITPARK